MLSLRLRNFRSFDDTGQIEIRPITILVGRNGSGKSSITRFLPMLRQSVEVRSSAPLLWYGQYVDFGSIRDAESQISQANGISVSLSIDDVKLPYREFSTGSMWIPRFRHTLDRRAKRIAYTAQLEPSEEKTSINSFVIKIDDDIIDIKIDKDRKLERVCFNDQDLTQILSRSEIHFTTDDLIPYPFSLTPKSEEASRTGSMDTALEALLKAYKNELHGNVQTESVRRITRRNFYLPEALFLKQLEAYSSEMQSWKPFIENLRKKRNKKKLDNIRALHFFSEFQDIILQIETIFSNVFKNITYLGPARATSERYYRLQELAVDQIDPRGENFAMFLSSLTDARAKDFSSWVENFLGHKIQTERLAGHVSVTLTETDSLHDYNLADMGYGFSQVLPILAQVWNQRYSRGRGRTDARIIALEQPELHLHPALQANLADAFVAAIYRGDQERARRLSGLNLLIETHSDALISRLGELVNKKVVNANDVAIYVFERSSEEECTEIRSSYFDDEGRLKNWPYGFFSRDGGNS